MGKGKKKGGRPKPRRCARTVSCMLMIAAVIGLPGCTSTQHSLDSEHTRLVVKNIRQGIEPFLRELVMAEDDADKLAKFEELVTFADDIGFAWDKYLVDGVGGDDLAAQLSAAMDALDALVALFVEDEDRAKVAAISGMLRVIIFQVATDVGDDTNAERAEKGLTLGDDEATP